MLEEVEFVRRTLGTATGITVTSGVNGQIATPSKTALAAGSFLLIGPFTDQDALYISGDSDTWTGGGGFFIDVETPEGFWVTAQCYSAITGVPIPIGTAPFLTGAGMNPVRCDVGGFINARIRASGTINFSGATIFFQGTAYKLQSITPAMIAAALSGLTVTVPNPLPVSGPLTDAQLAARLPLSVLPPSTASANGTITAGSGVNGALSTLTSTSLAANSSISLALNGQETLTVAMTQGTWAGGGTMYVDVSPDGGTNWITKTIYSQGGSLGGQLDVLTFATTIKAVGRVDVGGMTHVRLRGSGTITPSVNPTFYLIAFAGETLERISTQAPCSTAAQSSVAENLSNVTLLAANAARLGATIFNETVSSNLLLKLGVTASTTSYTVKLTPGAYYEVPYRYTGQIDGIWDVADAGGSARITELTA